MYLYKNVLRRVKEMNLIISKLAKKVITFKNIF